MTYSAWASLPTILANGFQSGVASSEQFNTLMRQVSVPAAGLAQWASDTAGANANDDGSVTNFKNLINSAVSARLSAYLPLSGGTMSGPLVITSVYGMNQLLTGTGDGASYSTFNVAIKGWWGMGMVDYNNNVTGYYDFRSGKWDCKGGFFVNGSRVWDQTNFNPGNYLPLAGGTISGDVSVTGYGVFGSGIYSYGSIRFVEDGNDTGFFPNGNNQFSVLCGGASVMQWRMDGISSYVPITAPTEPSSEASTKLATTAHVTNKINALFTGSSGNSGWSKNSLGQIEQWGRISLGDVPSGGTAGTFTFPIAFPSECSVCMVTAADSASGITVFTSMGANPTTTSMTWKVGETASFTQSVTIHIWARGH